jgi:hypothetical protein
MIFHFTDGAGVGRLFEATRAPSVVNSYSFTSYCNLNNLFTDGAGVGRLFEATRAPSVVNSYFFTSYCNLNYLFTDGAGDR